jgi:prepilin-type N-terminal cleavage/methylation domain-containing protein
MKTRFTNILQKFTQTESGMTLIELLVAMTIVGILLAATTTMLPYYRDNQMLKQGSLDLNDSLRYAQTLALEKDKNSHEYVEWKLIDEHKICVISSKEREANPNCENAGKIYEFDKKLNITTNLENIYFQGGTANIYDDSDFGTAGLANIEVAVKHSNRSQIGDTYYGVKIAANSFGMVSDSIKEETESDDDNTGGVDEPIERCGDQACSTSENCELCPTDCGKCESPCGNGSCTDNENYQNCPQDCDQPANYCGNGRCDANESFTSCPAECEQPIVCGDGDCDVTEENTCTADCIHITPGCTDRIATNFNPDANQDDGSCDYVLGCMDDTAYNYNPLATKSDGSCIAGLNDGSSCQLNTDCGSGNCKYSICKPKLTTQMQCTEDIQCLSGECECRVLFGFYKVCNCK